MREPRVYESVGLNPQNCDAIQTPAIIMRFSCGDNVSLKVEFDEDVCLLWLLLKKKKSKRRCLVHDRRHRSSSSLAGNLLEATRSERKLDNVNASILEVDDQFGLAEARCDDLQEKLDILKSLKKKRKLKKRSATKILEQPSTPENLVHISVRTQPKKKVSQHAARLRRLEVPQNPTRGYLDPATVEQHRMIGQIRGYKQTSKQAHPVVSSGNRVAGQREYPMSPHRRPYAEGDSMPVNSWPDEMVNQDETEFYGHGYDRSKNPPLPNKRHGDSHVTPHRRRHVPRSIQVQQDEQSDVRKSSAVNTNSSDQRPNSNRAYQHLSSIISEDERPVVELFSKSRDSPPLDLRQDSTPSSPVDYRMKKGFDAQRYENVDSAGNNTNLKSQKVSAPTRRLRRVKYRSHRYELPTVASQMKQAGVRYYYNPPNTNRTNIPFVVSKSTAPSHNIGVNIQQVLNGLKIQQPLSGIPLTIAHHMGLGHIPNAYKIKGTALRPLLGPRDINAIKVGQRLVRLPSYKYMSYNRLLNLYREGDGMVPKFLRAISRPHFFYTSMYKEDYDGATSKGRGGSNEAKQSLAEYARLYREYEKVEKCLKEGNYDPELERRKEELEKELAARDDHIRRVIQEYRTNTEGESMLRASASIAEDTIRHSKFKLGDSQQ